MAATTVAHGSMSSPLSKIYSHSHDAGASDPGEEGYGEGEEKLNSRSRSGAPSSLISGAVATLETPAGVAEEIVNSSGSMFSPIGATPSFSAGGVVEHAMVAWTVVKNKTDPVALAVTGLSPSAVSSAVLASASAGSVTG